MKLSVNSETGTLETVVIGYAGNFHVIPPEVINETQKFFYHGPQHPKREKIIGEYQRFQEALEQSGVNVIVVDPVSNVPDQLTPRDIAFTIGDVLVISRMAKASRQDEWQGLSSVLGQIAESKVIRCPEDTVIEGGDVVFDRGIIYVGTGQRTTQAGVNFLKQSFPKLTVEAINLTSLSEGENVLHLDCVFVPIGSSSALIYRPGFKAVPASIENNYALIEVNAEEQAKLGSNVLSISPQKLISMPQFSRLNREICAHGIEVVEVDFSETIKAGGSFRCGSMPLRRAALSPSSSTERTLACV